MEKHKIQKESKFIQVLKNEMKTRNLNQLELSGILNIRQSQISNWINGKSLPGYSSLQALKNKLGVRVETFFD